MTSLSETSILAGTSGASTGYTIKNSCRFNDDDSPGLTKTFGTATDTKKWTISAWVKLIGKTDEASGGVRLMDAGSASGSEDLVSIGSGYAGYEKLYFWKRTSSSYNFRLESNRLFRDPAAWYHVVFNYDSDNTISTERARMYVNGVRETDLAQNTYPSSGLASRINTNIAHGVGKSVNTSGTVYYSDGYLAEYYFLDGYSYGPENFGEFDDNGIWIPKEYSGAYGNNGFRFEFKNSGSLGADTSGNGNNFASTGLAVNDQKIDTPTNNQITFNPLNNQRNGGTPSNGNLDYEGPGTRTLISLTANIPSTGKWAIAFKVAQVSTNAGWEIGIAPADQSDFGDAAGSNEDLKLIHMNPSSSDLNISDFVNSASIDPSLPITTSDEFWVAVDMDSGNVYLGIYDESATSMKWVANDTGLDGNPATGDNPTVTYNTTQMPRDNVVFAVGSKDTSNDIYLQRSTDVSGTTPSGYTYFENVKDLL
jgi:hypothetical protein